MNEFSDLFRLAENACAQIYMDYILKDVGTKDHLCYGCVSFLTRKTQALNALGFLCSLPLEAELRSHEFAALPAQSLPPQTHGPLSMALCIICYRLT